MKDRLSAEDVRGMIGDNSILVIKELVITKEGDIKKIAELVNYVNNFKIGFAITSEAVNSISDYPKRDELKELIGEALYEEVQKNYIDAIFVSVEE